MTAYPSPRTALASLGLTGLAATGYLWPPAFQLAAWSAWALALAAVIDLLLTSRALRGMVTLRREFPQSITVALPRRGSHLVENRSRLPLRARVYEDVLPEFSKSSPEVWLKIAPRGSAASELVVTASRRGELSLAGAGLRVIAGLGLWVLQYRYDWPDVVKVYPLIEELTRGDLFAHRRRLYAIGQHHSRKFGRGTEFDRLREYTEGDEFRSINWKATARAGKPVVNQFQVEQSRDLILLIDCGRLMHTDIAGRPRLDRYLDAAVHLAYLALGQRDRVGLIAFDSTVKRFVPTGRRPGQLDQLIEAVFDLEPTFVESDYGRAVTTLRSRQPKRGLVVLFTDLLDSISSRSAVAHLSRLARTHLPLIVILDDPAIPRLSDMPAQTTSDAYVKSAAEKFIGEKRRTLQQLRSRGCLIVNVTADRLNTSLVNEYLEVKARNLL